MLVDTHCHINLMVKKEFDIPISQAQLTEANNIIKQAQAADVNTIINVGTSYIESLNSIKISQEFDNVYSTIGIHPNDLKDNWKEELKALETKLKFKDDFRIVGIGETGLDFHYPNYNMQKQLSAFKEQIELALKYDLGLVVHSRDAYDQTLKALEEYSKENLRATLHCFSYDQSFANQVISWNFVIGIDGPITYPKNEHLRLIVKNVPLNSIILETDAPYLPPQIIRGKQNHPMHIKTIAEYIASLRNKSFSAVCQSTTDAANKIFNL